MKGYLNKNQINYILFHLSFLIEDFKNIRKYFYFIKVKEDTKSNIKAIYFILQNNKLSLDNITYYKNIPILFPNTKHSDIYSINKNCLVFNHDIIKSAFYLLSGYQEYKADKKDEMGRYPYELSIQKQLKIIDKPIVNYYFDLIIKGIEEFCHMHSITFKRKKVFKGLNIMLTHDIDKIKTYSVNNLKYRLKQLIGLADSQLSKKIILKLFLNNIVQLILKNKNPYWNFDEIRDNEKKYGYKSVFYFLYNEKKYHDSDYIFSNQLIIKQILKLYKDDCEIGLHGTYNSISNKESMKKIYIELKNISPQPPIGIRQHRLLFNNPETIHIQESVGLKYDTTLGFPEHEGFRNSYCQPFRIYDFDRDNISAIWEIPLNVMDTTLFSYKKLTLKNAINQIESLIKEIKKFDGIFTLLLHNGLAFKYQKPELKNFYNQTLEVLNKYNANNLTGIEILSQIENS